MAITFFQQRKKQRYLILAFILIILVVLLLVWQFFLLEKPKPKPKIIEGPKPAEIKINFEVLKDPILEGLQPFEEIPPFEEKVGRENPFIPY